MQGQKSLKLSPDCNSSWLSFVPVVSICCSFEGLVGALSNLAKLDKDQIMDSENPPTIRGIS